MMFGPSDKDSTHSDQSMKWKIKRFSNDDLRQKFVDASVPQAEYLGLTIPDKNIKFNEKTGHYDFSEIKWDELFEVIKGNGPCNQQRMDTRNKAHNDGAWVREAAAAYAEKQSNKKEVA